MRSETHIPEFSYGVTIDDERFTKETTLLESYADLLRSEEPVTETKKERKVASYVGCRLANMSYDKYSQLVGAMKDDYPLKAAQTKRLEVQAPRYRFLEVGFIPTTDDEKVAVEVCRMLLSKITGEELFPVCLDKIPNLKQVEDPFFGDIAKFLLTSSRPRVVEKTSYKTLYDNVLVGIKKYIMSGKVYQVSKPKSMVNIREILLYDMQRFAITLLCNDAKFRQEIYQKYSLSERSMKVKGLHNPMRIKSVLTKNEFDTIEMDSELKTAWDLQTKRSKDIIQGIANGTIVNAKKATMEANTEFVRAVGKSSLKIAYSRMKKRNTLISSARKVKNQKVSTPKLSYVLSKMLQSHDKYGNPNLIMFSLYRDDFVAVWSRFVSCSQEKDTFVYQWLDKESGIDSFDKVRDWLRANPNLESDSDSEPQVPDE